jgi:DNA polymerase III subunit epsilon
MTEPMVIVDLETTGTSATYGRIIEIGIIRLERGKVKRVFESLVDPECYIHPMIEQITGIANRDVSGAPVFSEISREVYRLLEGAVFVAHNARFDEGFLKQEFARVGRTFAPRTLCTMKLSRRLFPEHRKHDLGSIIERYALDCPARHRAMGDARAVLAFLEYLRAHQPEDRLADAFKHVVKDMRLPPHIDRADVRKIPDCCGVYLFYGAKDELLYVGKSKNIRTRVLSHFAADTRSTKEMELSRCVVRIESRPTPGELGALLLESSLIKQLHPIYNVMSRRTRRVLLARGTIGAKGYLGVKLEETEAIAADDSASIMAVFKSRKQAEEFLHTAIQEHELCSKLLGLERPKGACFAYHLHQCHGACVGEEAPEAYNQRVERAFQRRRVVAWPFKGTIAIKEVDAEGSDTEAFFVDNWCLVGSARTGGDMELMQRSKAVRFDYDTYKILLRYLTQPSNRKHIMPVNGDTPGAPETLSWEPDFVADTGRDDDPYDIA